MDTTFSHYLALLRFSTQERTLCDCKTTVIDPLAVTALNRLLTAMSDIIIGPIS